MHLRPLGAELARHCLNLASLFVPDREAFFDEFLDFLLCIRQLARDLFFLR